MARYTVGWVERISRTAEVEAGDPAEAVARVKRGEWIEGTQDSEPGIMDLRTVKVDDAATRAREKVRRERRARAPLAPLDPMVAKVIELFESRPNTLAYEDGDE